jgi:hypothetical protein
MRALIVLGVAIPTYLFLYYFVVKSMIEVVAGLVVGVSQ